MVVEGGETVQHMIAQFDQGILLINKIVLLIS